MIPEPEFTALVEEARRQGISAADFEEWLESRGYDVDAS